MARIINKDQQVVRRGVSPRPYYSRVIGFFLYVIDDGNWHYANTPVLGQRIWLLRVTIRHCPRPANPVNFTNYEILTGKTRPHTLADIGTWEYVIPNAAEADVNISFQIGDGCNEISESMSKLYDGEARRFGIIAQRVGTGADKLWVSFLISEG